MLLTSLLLVLIFLGWSDADYNCICSNNEEIPLYSDADSSSSVIGYMYRFDCFAVYNVTRGDQWKAVTFDHQVGYLQLDSQMEQKICFGDMPEEAKLTTRTIVSTSSNSVNQQTDAPPSTEQPTTVSMPSTVTTTKSTTSTTATVEITSPSTEMLTRQTVTSSVLHYDNKYLLSLCPHEQHVIIGAHGHSCYEFVYSPNTFAHAETDCKKHGGFLAEILNQNDEHFIRGMFARVRYNGPVWIGLHDRNNEGHWEWLSGTSVNYTNWVPGHTDIHNDKDCVAYMADEGLGGQWKELKCGVVHSSGFIFSLGGNTNAHPWLCQYPAPPGGHQITNSSTTANPNVHSLCPNLPGHTADIHDNKCYELSAVVKDWADAEATCKHYGGHLFTVLDADTNKFIFNLLKKAGYRNSVWMGLQDQAHEDHWQWVTGTPLSYTNWDTHLFKNNIPSQEDCAVYVSSTGTWTDTFCNSGIISNHRHRFICEFS